MSSTCTRRPSSGTDQLADILGAALAPGDELMRVFRSLVSSVTVLPRQPHAETQIEIKGYLRALLGWDSALDAVAEVGLEPPTHGL